MRATDLRRRPPSEEETAAPAGTGRGALSEMKRARYTPAPPHFQAAREICDALGGCWHGSYGVALCPAHENTRTPALSIADGRDGRLIVNCFAGCEGADVLRAIRARGLGGEWRPDREAAARREAEDAAQDRRRMEQARRCWHEAGSITGSLAERYLRARGIRCALPPTLRFSPECWHGPTAARLPAMVAAVSIDHKLVGVHRTYLAAPGVKAFDNAKLMLGCCAGGAVRLSCGSGPLILAEGIETALSLLSGLSDRSPRVWACLSTSGMAGLSLPRDPGELAIAPDGDLPGRRAAFKLADRASLAGWRVRMMACEPGRDWNDILNVKECAT